MNNNETWFYHVLSGTQGPVTKLNDRQEHPLPVGLYKGSLPAPVENRIQCSFQQAILNFCSLEDGF